MLLVCSNRSYSLLKIFDTHKSTYLLESTQFKGSIDKVPKPNETMCENYTGFNINLIVYYGQPQHPYFTMKQ